MSAPLRTEGLPLTDRELDAMHVVWDRGEATVRDLLDRLPDDTPYTSALSIFPTLDRKGFVDHRREGRHYVYLPTVTETECRRTALRYVIRRYFRGDDREFEMMAATEIREARR